MIAYVRLSFHDSRRGAIRTVWASDNQHHHVGAMSPGVKFRIFSRVTAEGEAIEPREVICLSGNDLISATPARMNLHYGRLEIVKGGQA